jgi:hypothetical protein
MRTADSLTNVPTKFGTRWDEDSGSYQGTIFASSNGSNSILNHKDPKIQTLSLRVPHLKHDDGVGSFRLPGYLLLHIPSTSTLLKRGRSTGMFVETIIDQTQRIATVIAGGLKVCGATLPSLGSPGDSFCHQEFAYLDISPGATFTSTS